MAYLIDINEQQRLALIEVLKKADLTETPENTDPAMGEHCLKEWVGMLNELPEHEAAHPRIIHGFCL